ncbi:MAG TPA: hypothetical protein PKC59_08990 [Burkholderiaceae bacterium]|nr:hypothetical protein [Burkholderiaceae bacterium]HMY99476.1 hypothetical protein [Burkholderiaceae bacterium]HNB44025.1 hypothetical protein [Burkholderiaceae bacterium]HNG81973.1 hypothetical protein [Burkholderiaceae bacterium]
MSAPSTSFRDLVRSVTGAAVSAAALLTASPAQALDLTQVGSEGVIGAYLSQALRAKGASVVGEDPGSAVGALAIDIKNTLAIPQSVAKAYSFPKQYSPDLLAFAYAVPANGQGDVYVCAHRGGKAVGYYRLTDGKAPVEAVQWSGNNISVTLPDGRVRTACADFAIAARDAMNSAQAPAQGGSK